jgi:very-short-patch-repair endonuclease
MVRLTRFDRVARDQRPKLRPSEISRTEWRLCYRLRRRQLMATQVSTPGSDRPYFADFACLEARLAVEVDGDHHRDQLL